MLGVAAFLGPNDGLPWPGPKGGFGTPPVVLNLRGPVPRAYFKDCCLLLPPTPTCTNSSPQLVLPLSRCLLPLGAEGLCVRGPLTTHAGTGRPPQPVPGTERGPTGPDIPRLWIHACLWASVSASTKWSHAWSEGACVTRDSPRCVCPL